MSFPAPEKLQLPVKEYNVAGYKFHKRVRRWFALWAIHLGDDIVAPAGTGVRAIGDGEVVWSEMRLGDDLKRNWGGIVVLAHESRLRSSFFNFQTFYSVYGHMRDLRVGVGDSVKAGQQLGIVASSYTPENGWWKVPHIHFAIYTGPWEGKILPGYKRVEEFRTKVKWWKDPKVFIDRFNKQRP